MKISSKYIFVFIILLFSSTSTLSLNKVIVDDSINAHPIGPIGKHLEYIQDNEKKININNIKDPSLVWNSFDNRYASFGRFDKSVYWFRFALDIQYPIDNLIFKIDYTALDDIQLYIPDNKGGYKIKKSGDKISFKFREINNRNPVFSVNINSKKQKIYYIKVESIGSTRLPILILTNKMYSDNLIIENLLLGLFYGIMISILLYNIFLAFFVKELAYIYYVLFLITYILLQLLLNGLPLQLLWQSSPIWNNICLPFLMCFIFFWACLFFRSYLQTYVKYPFLNKILIFSIFISFISSIFSLTFNYYYTIRYANTFTIVMATVLFIVPLIASFKGDRSARFILMSFGLLLIGAAIFALKDWGLAPVNLFTRYSVQLSSPIAVLLFTIGLVDKINVMKKEKDEAQILSIENLYKVNKLKDEFLANTSHELRTPLHGIIGIADSLLNGIAGNPNDEMKSNLSIIINSGRRLTQLINDILDFSKIKNNELQIDISSIDLGAVIKIAIEICMPTIGNKKLNLISTINPNTLFVLADENRLQQILINLISNAIKYSEIGIIKINAYEEEDDVIIQVIDTGIGITKENQLKIFDLFYQTDGSIKRHSSGTGIGLTITKRLIELHKGNINVKSNEESGSTFYFNLKKGNFDSEKNNQQIKEDFTHYIHEKNTLHESSDTKEILKGKPTILVVDDDPVNIKVIKNNLKNNDYNILAAFNGKEALTLIANNRNIDLVLLDVMMPGMSGYDVAREIRKNYENYELPIMMLTAKFSINNITTGFSAGANDYLIKPTETSELLARAKTLIQLKKSVKEGMRLKEIEKDLDLAQSIQQSNIQKSEQQIQEFSIGKAYIPMFSVCGDFFDINYNNSTLSIFMADVTGHGIAAALIASMIKVLYSTKLENSIIPSEILYYINNYICNNIGPIYLTASSYSINEDKTEISFARGGHEPLLIQNKNTNTIKQYQPKGITLGMQENITFENMKIPITSEDRIILYTDGIIEIFNEYNEIFGLKRFKEILEHSIDFSPQETVNKIIEEIKKFNVHDGEFDDDITIVIVDIE